MNRKNFTVAVLGLAAFGLTACNQSAEHEDMSGDNRLEGTEMEYVKPHPVSLDLKETASSYEEQRQNELAKKEAKSRQYFISDPNNILMVSDGESRMERMVSEAQEFSFEPRYAVNLTLIPGDRDEEFGADDEAYLKVAEITGMNGSQIIDKVFNTQIFEPIFDKKLSFPQASAEFNAVINGLNDCRYDIMHSKFEGQDLKMHSKFEGQDLKGKCSAFRPLAR